MTYQNVMLYSHATPVYDSKSGGKRDAKKEKDTFEWNDSLDANNPDNFTDEPTDKVKEIH
ncbi:MAG: hypothetical protein NC344_10200 [Bacteroidales bacterium]|nr:hypothetical protein [Bacteroidales bacterium]MCM1148175.1 hypothetical protein [Bacteroidales bacterium]MCM1207098.1 hypothetical protein [Bacillota bacterium]MCM1510850.1 hypothetical protein [Clostridium sp.]